MRWVGKFTVFDVLVHVGVGINLVVAALLVGYYFLGR